MSITPTAPYIVAVAEESLSGLWEKVTGLFGGQGFAPHTPLEQTPGIDPRLLPRVPMTSDNLDVGLLAKLSHEGFKRGKEITAQTHPELHHIWVSMCKRAGLNRVPQLIQCDSKAMNAASLSGENAVMISDEMFRKLDLREISGVLGHELGHETSNHTGPRVLAATGLIGAGAIWADSLAHRGGIGSTIPYPKMSESWFKRTTHYLFGSEGKALSFLGSAKYIFLGGWLGLTAAKQLTVHPTELDADHKGAIISGDPEALAGALHKLETHRAPVGLWKHVMRTYRFLTSGYPSTENRIAKLHTIAQHMPPGVTPVYLEVEGAAQATPKPQPETAMNILTPQSPSPQVSGVTIAERSMSTPEPVPVTAL